MKLKIKHLKFKNSSGIFLLEVLIALGVFVMATGAAIALFFGGQTISVDGLNSQKALDYGQEGLEAARSLRDSDWSLLTTGQHGLILFDDNTWHFTTTTSSDSRGIFTRTIVITELDENTRQASTTISWQIDPTRPQSINLTTILTNWRGPLSGGCTETPAFGDWAHPQLLGQKDLDPSVNGSDVVVQWPYAYVSGKSSTSSKHDIFVFDVSNPASITLVKSLDIGSGGIEDLYVSGNYLYAASPNDNKELIIFNNVSTPASMSEVGSYNLTGSSDALAVFAFGSTTVIGRTESASNELVFLNVANPNIPTIILQTSTGGDIEDFYANGTTLYLVSQQSDPDIWWYDISNPLIPVFINNYDIPGTTEDVSIYLQNKNGQANLIAGNENNNEVRTVGTYSSTTGDFYLRDILPIGGDVLDVICAKGDIDLYFLATANSNQEFVIVNGNNPDSLSVHGTFNLSNIATGIDFYNNRVYVAVRSNDSLKILGPGP